MAQSALGDTARWLAVVFHVPGVFLQEAEQSVEFEETDCGCNWSVKTSSSN